MAAEGQSDTMASDMEVCMAQRCGTEFLLAEKMPLIDIHQYLPNVSGDQTVDVSTVRQWVVCFSSSNSDSVSAPLVQISMSRACRLLFIAGEVAQVMVVTVEKQRFVAENLLYQIVLLYSFYLFPWK